MSNFNFKSLSLPEDGILKISALIFHFQSLSTVITEFACMSNTDSKRQKIELKQNIVLSTLKINL